MGPDPRQLAEGPKVPWRRFHPASEWGLRPEGSRASANPLVGTGISDCRALGISELESAHLWVRSVPHMAGMWFMVSQIWFQPTGGWGRTLGWLAEGAIVS